MSFYTDADQFYDNLQALFARIEAGNSGATEALLQSKLRFRFCCSEPDAVLVVDARKRPLQIQYGHANTVKPDLDITLSADTLHQILLGELSLTKAMGSKQLKPTGPIWKTMVLADLFRQAKTIYPEILQEQGFA
ncbi:MAG: SCP2 sterol-binding domain-containing protein [Chloroflexi bacterium]|nr:SCP2 sterol-binding domain-containing protein [Chloroflexota bacterium]